MIDLSRTTSNFFLNQLWGLIRQEAHDFAANYQTQHKNTMGLDNKHNEILWKRNKGKYRLTIKDKIAIVHSILIEKQSAKKTASDFKISASFVFSVLKSYKKDELNKLLTKTKKAILENN